MIFCPACSHMLPYSMEAPGRWRTTMTSFGNPQNQNVRIPAHGQARGLNTSIVPLLRLKYHYNYRHHMPYNSCILLTRFVIRNSFCLPRRHGSNRTTVQTVSHALCFISRYSSGDMQMLFSYILAMGLMIALAIRAISWSALRTSPSSSSWVQVQCLFTKPPCFLHKQLAAILTKHYTVYSQELCYIASRQELDSSHNFISLAVVTWRMSFGSKQQGCKMGDRCSFILIVMTALTLFVKSSDESKYINRLSGCETNSQVTTLFTAISRSNIL